MKSGKSFQNYQLEAIQNFYRKLQSRVEERITLKDAIIEWFANGHAEKFREEYLKHQMAVQ